MHTDRISNKRLNPFAFPAETNVRFTLLILAVLMIGVSLSVLIGIVLLAVSNPYKTPLPIEGSENQPLDFSVSAILTGLGDVLINLAIPAFSMLLVFGMAFIIYRKHPERIRHQRKLIPLDRDEHPLVLQEFINLTHRARISPLPDMEMSSGISGQKAQAFGLPKDYIIGLDGGIRLLLHKAPAAFRALILHELAHIANRDIERTYYAHAVWHSVMYVIAFPLILILCGVPFISCFLSFRVIQSGDPQFINLIVGNIIGILAILIGLGIPLAVVAMVYTGLLRVREFYADWRTALWDADETLKKILATRSSIEDRKRKFRWRRFHPTAQRRLAMLKDPIDLFRVTFDLPVFTGVLLGFIITGLILIVFKFLGILQDIINTILIIVNDLASPNVVNILANTAILIPLGLSLLLFIGLGYLVAGTVGLQVQRETVAMIITGHRGYSSYLRLFLPAAMIALGLEAGSLIAPPYVFSPIGALLVGLVASKQVLLLIPWFFGFAGLNWLGLAYARFLSGRILGSHTGTSPPVRKIQVITLVLSIMLGVFYFPLLAIRVVILFPVPDDLPLITVFNTGLSIGLITFGLIFGITWLIITFFRRRHPPRCPFCRKPTQHRHVVGQVCAYCNNELAPWLFVTSQIETQPHESGSEPLHKIQA